MQRKNILDEQFSQLESLLENYDDLSISLQFKLVQNIYDLGLNGQQKLLQKLIFDYFNKSDLINCIHGFIFELLLKSTYPPIIQVVNQYFYHGIVPLKSACNIDYLTLQQLLLKQQFQKADHMTHLKLCELAQIQGNHAREWLYFTDVSLLPALDLYTIDKLWSIHSRGLFGISIQRKIWLSSDSDWNKFWDKIGWKVNELPRRYPQEFIWNLNAPPGHLPLFNQLRGVQVLSALFMHPVWNEKQKPIYL
uniref:GUN4-like domain-containing protein n=1 Tax=Kumanoa americana TaxID=1196377 RepID=A0A1C9CGM7_9FLOR|nr:hypothetical protein Kuma_116 [Kumanoa americana]AOM67550.1 hypothetical protein Kuma_116 [Kumanoa americana]